MEYYLYKFKLFHQYKQHVMLEDYASMHRSFRLQLFSLKI